MVESFQNPNTSTSTQKFGWKINFFYKIKTVQIKSANIADSLKNPTWKLKKQNKLTVQ